MDQRTTVDYHPDPYAESEIDEDELQRQLEEEMAKLNYQPGQDDEFEKSSTYSMFNSSMANFNPSGGGFGVSERPKLTEDDMDIYLERLL